MAGVNHSGSCACGRVAFEAAGGPVWSAYCHCEDCRRATGAPVTHWVGFANTHVRWTGERALRAGDGEVSRGFCRDCGTPLSYEDATISGGETYLAIGAFADPAAVRPAAHAFWDSRLPYMDMNDGLPRHATYSRARAASTAKTE